MTFARGVLSFFLIALLSLSAACDREAEDGAALSSSPASYQQTQQPPADYPYKTWQGNEPNCVPRAFECHTGQYDPSLMGGPVDQNGQTVQWIDSAGQTFYGHGPGQLPAQGDVVYYDYDRTQPGIQGHAGICTGYTSDGQCIIATGHQNNPYDTRLPSELEQTYTPARPIP